jgi:TRAP-type C4-dicarboxylate transport system permease small subunit
MDGSGSNKSAAGESSLARVARRIFNFLELHLPSFVLFLLVATVSTQVFSRYVLNRPLPKFFELSIYSFVWVIYLGAALAKRYDRHIRFDIINKKLSEKARAVIEIFFDLLTNVLFLILLVPSIRYTAWNYRVKASALRVPWTYLLLCFPIFIILIVIHNSASIAKNIRFLSGGKTPSPEELPWL